MLMITLAISVFALQRIGGIIESGEQESGRKAIPSSIDLQKLHKERVVDGKIIASRFEILLDGSIYEIYGDGIAELRYKSGPVLFAVTSNNLDYLQQKCTEYGGGEIYMNHPTYTAKCLATGNFRPLSEDKSYCESWGYTNPQACSGGGSGGSGGGTTTSCTFPYSSLSQCISCGYLQTRCEAGKQQELGYANGVCAYTTIGTCETTQICSDSDGGRTYNIQGIVTIGNSNYQDNCIQKSTTFPSGGVTEYYCDPTKSAGYTNEFISCQYGCLNGACSTEQKQEGCVSGGANVGKYLCSSQNLVYKCESDGVLRGPLGGLGGDSCPSLGEYTGICKLYEPQFGNTVNDVCKSKISCVEGKYYCYGGIISKCEGGIQLDKGRCSDQGNYINSCKISEPSYGNSISEVCGTSTDPGQCTQQKPSDTEWTNPNQACGTRTIFTCVSGQWKGTEETKQCDTTDPCSKCSTNSFDPCSEIECTSLGTKSQCNYYKIEGPTVDYCSSNPPPEVCCRNLNTGVSTMTKISCTGLQTGDTKFMNVDKSFCLDSGGICTKDELCPDNTNIKRKCVNGKYESVKDCPGEQRKSTPLTLSEFKRLEDFAEQTINEKLDAAQCDSSKECVKKSGYTVECLKFSSITKLTGADIDKRDFTNPLERFSDWLTSSKEDGICIATEKGFEEETSICRYFTFLNLGENSCSVGIIGSIIIIIFIFGIIFK